MTNLQITSYTEIFLLDRLHVNEGMLMENIVAQELRASGHKLFFLFQIRYKQSLKIIWKLIFKIEKEKNLSD